MDSGEMAAKGEYGLEVWKYVANKDNRLTMFALQDDQTSDIISSVVGHTDTNGFFVVQDAWTDTTKRQQGYITALYKTLHDKMQMSLASDTEQSPGMMQVWKKLPMKQKVYDRETGKTIPREQISDDEIYNDKNPTRYRLIIESSNRYDNFGITGVGDTVLYEQQYFTHPSNKGKFI